MEMLESIFILNTFTSQQSCSIKSDAADPVHTFTTFIYTQQNIQKCQTQFVPKYPKLNLFLPGK